MSLDLGLKDVHVLITGAAGGIGFSLVQTFAALGARVTAHINSNRGALDTIPDITILKADVRSEQSINDLFAQAATQNGGLVSVLIVNHGIWPTNDAPISNMSLDQWQNTLSVNLTGPFLICKAYLRALGTAPASVKDHANIIFIGSTAGKFGEASHGDYAASKAALMYGLT
ncbi:hypothetical protein LTR95_018872, partial [Oleoguttula sp. CCFEE 5521]